MANQDYDSSSTTTTMMMDHHYMPSETQQYVISWLQIGPSILSLAGSYLIIYNIRRNTEKSKSPYRRIMFSLSRCTILSAIGWILEPFLVPSESFDKQWVYAVGNNASCVVLGSISQFSITQHLFLAFLSLYFLLTVKFGVSQRDFEAKYEMWMHGFIYTFALGTVIAGISLGYFRPNLITPGCWINPPETEDCGGGCPESIFAIMVGAVPFLLSLLTIIVSNAMLYAHVRSTVVEGQKKVVTNELKLAGFTIKSNLSSPAATPDESISHTGSLSETNHAEEELDESARSQQQQDVTEGNVGDTIYPKEGGSTICKNESVLSEARGTVLSSSSKQWRRVRQVGHQAFLYVGAYMITFSWTFLLHYLNTLNFEYKAGSGNVLFPLMVLQAIGGGSLGWIMALIYFVPKIKQTRTKYEYEPWWWVLEMAITGDAERVERFSSISNVSSIKSDRSVGSPSPHPKRSVVDGAKPKKKLSWKADLSPLNVIPTAIDVDTSEQFKNHMENSLPRLPLEEMMIEEGEEELDEEPDTTDTDLEHSGCFLVEDAPIDPTGGETVISDTDIVEHSGGYLAIDASGSLKTGKT